MTLPQAIENLYETFEGYSAAGMTYCTCGCTNPEAVAKLLRTPLWMLKEELACYQGSAIYTIGDLEHYKHFLPRICELIALEPEFWVGLDDLEGKLSYAEWKKWPREEYIAVQQYFEAYWAHTVNNTIQHYLKWNEFVSVLDFKIMLSQWKVSNSRTALEDFIEFFFYEGNTIIVDKYKINGRKVMRPIMEFIEENRLYTLVENYFFEIESINPVKAAEASAVIGILDAYSESFGGS